eukprot:scaffold130561_cov12-Tisochrysis_lutea.AAC.1
MKGTLVLARIGNGGNGLYCSLTSLPVFCSFTPILDDPTCKAYFRKLLPLPGPLCPSCSCM